MASLGIPMAVLTRAQQVLDDVGAPADATTLLTGRAALLGLAPNGAVSAGGATRLMAARDGWFAVTLSRPDDLDTVPALIGSDGPPDDVWSALAAWVGRRGAAEATERARLLGLPAATLDETAAEPPRARTLGRRGVHRTPESLLVADLSSMWAGPLCGKLLLQAGATVVKIETRHRPDGTRAGPAVFFDWMNGGKLCYETDLDEPSHLRALLEVADVVIEGSRPTALHRRGLGPDDVAGPDGRVWLRMTGHGSAGERGDRVAFGDDAAVSGGLVDRGGPGFIGDAIADPLSGVTGMAAVVESLARGGGELIEVSMAAVAASYAALPDVDDHRCLTTTSAPEPSSAGAQLGADNPRVDHLVAERRLATC